MKNLLKSEINTVCGGATTDLTTCDGKNTFCNKPVCDFTAVNANVTIYRLVIESNKAFDTISKKFSAPNNCFETTTSKEKICVKCINPNKVNVDIEL